MPLAARLSKWMFGGSCVRNGAVGGVAIEMDILGSLCPKMQKNEITDTLLCLHSVKIVSLISESVKEGHTSTSLK